MANRLKARKVLWLRVLLNGLLAWIKAFVIYMIPGLVVPLIWGLNWHQKPRIPR